jgi:hypothetical protein
MKKIRGSGHVTARRARQKGFGLVGMSALLVMLAGSVIIGYLTNRSDIMNHSIQDERAALRWADSLVKDYASRYGRLPCAASTRLGVEDCGVQEGWLPAKTLLNTTIVYPGSLTAAMQQVRYAPNKGNGGSPDLTSSPAGQFIPAVGPIVPGANDSTLGRGIAGAQINPMSAYMAKPSGADFCQQLQNTALGSEGVSVVLSQSLGPWSVLPVAGTVAYKLSVSGQSSAQSAADLYTAFQCESVNASLSVMATTAALSEPGGTILGLRQALINGPSGWADDNGPGSSGPHDWGSFHWMTTVLVPQLIVLDWIFTGVRASQGMTEFAKRDSSLTALAMPWFAIQAAASLQFYNLAETRRIVDLGAQALASINDTIYLGQYQLLLDKLWGFQPWGMPDSNSGVSPADDAVQKATEMGFTWEIGPTVTGTVNTK